MLVRMPLARQVLERSENCVIREIQIGGLSLKA